jgi:casein kinase 1 alpha
VQGYPAEFATYLNYCRGLKFNEVPDYNYIRKLFRLLFRTLNYQSLFFDWTTMLKQQKDASSAAGNNNNHSSQQQQVAN